MNVADDGIDDLDAALTTVLADVDTLKASAATLEPEVNALESSLQALQTAVGAAATPGREGHRCRGRTEQRLHHVGRIGRSGWR